MIDVAMTSTEADTVQVSWDNVGEFSFHSNSSVADLAEAFASEGFEMEEFELVKFERTRD